jgi:A/G-specific adenine glycosylase
LGTPTAFPQKKAAKELPTKYAYFLIIKNAQDELLWLKRPPTGIWGGLWCLPQVEAQNLQQLSEVLQQDWGIKEPQTHNLTSFRHTFSHYHLQVQPVQITGQVGLIKEQQSQWKTPQAASQSLGLPQAMSKILEMLG